MRTAQSVTGCILGIGVMIAAGQLICEPIGDRVVAGPEVLAEPKGRVAAPASMPRPVYYASVQLISPTDQGAEYVPPQLRRGSLPGPVFDDSGAAVAGEGFAEFVVNAEGRVGRPTIRSCSDVRLNRAILDDLVRWEFAPARLNGRNIATRLIGHFVFRNPSAS